MRIHEAEDRNGFAIVTSEFSRNILKRKSVAFLKYFNPGHWAMFPVEFNVRPFVRS